MNQQSKPIATEGVPQLEDIGLNNFAPYLMNRIMGRYNAHVRNDMIALGLSTPKMRVLSVLAIMDGPQIGELSVYAVVEQSTLSRVLDALEQENLVRRVADKSDSRASRIYITERGRTAFETLWPRMAESYDRMFAGISEKERKAFVVTLQSILRNIRQHDF
jgi:DNA-binding MarR family transcriptional regulator